MYHYHKNNLQNPWKECTATDKSQVIK